MILKNISYLDEEYNVQRGSIRIEGKLIDEIGIEIIPKADEEIVDGRGLLVTPGLCDTHTHIGQQLLKGKVLDAQGIIWKEIMLPFESSITPEIMNLNTRLAMIEMIKSGTTSFVDAGSYHMESACEEILKAGMRAGVTYSTMDDMTLPETIRYTADEIVQKNSELYDEWHGKGLIKVFYSIRSLMSASKELVLKVGEEAKKRGATIEAHMNEYDKEVEYVVEKTGLYPYEYLDSMGILDGEFIGAHSLILTENELDIVIRRDVKIAQCPFSNSGKALANTPELLRKGVKVGLGTDGVAHGGLSLWDEMKTLRCMMNVTWGVKEKNRSILSVKDILKLSMENGEYFLKEKIGKIREGYKADLIFIDLAQPHLRYSGNYTNTLLESVNKGDIIHSMIDGKWVMRDRELLTIDEKTTYKELEEMLK